GSAELGKRGEEGCTDFDVAIATPDQMGNVGKLGRILGPRGLMPNPKTGTVTMDVGKAVRDAKAGKLEYRTDRGANVHVSIGKKSFGERQLVENYAALVDEIVRAKPAAAKGRYIRQITLTSTMGPGIHVDPQKTRGILDDLEEQAEPVTEKKKPVARDRKRRQAPVREADLGKGSGKTGRFPSSTQSAEAFPRRIGEPRFPPPFSEPACVRARIVRG